MHRQLAAVTLVLLMTAGCSDGLPSPAAPTVEPVVAHNAGTPVNESAKPMDLAVIGDVPYGADALAAFPALVDGINADAKVRVVVHIGDIKSGSTECSDAWYEEMARQFDRFQDPLIYSIGDNEWTDCHRANNGGYDPIGRLAEVRDIFFASPGQALGGRGKVVDAEEGYPENQMWQESRVTFATFHVIGSNNGLDPWFDGAETPAQTAAREAEYTARNEANIAWLEQAFERASDEGSAGIVLFWHADLWHPDDRADGAVFTAHEEFVTRVADLAPGFDGPILAISGDSHNYRVDTGVPWFDLYGVTPPPNVTQIIVDRSIEDDTDWLRLHVDPRSPGVFSWEQVFVP